MKIYLKGKGYSKEELVSGYSVQNLSLYESELIRIVRTWEDEHDFVIRTSGSTGNPKEITFTTNQLKLSVQRTGNAFGLSSEDIAFVCINPFYVGGMMMIVRALYFNMDIIFNDPVSDPTTILTPQAPTFMAVVPLQLQSMVAKPKWAGWDSLKSILVGGAQVDLDLVESSKGFACNIYQTFGMTETASHFAYRLLNGENDGYYRVIDGWKVGIDDESRLKVKWNVEEDWLQTNDLVRMEKDDSFKWLGRSDNVVNSGGVKIIPEVIESIIREELLKKRIRSRFFVSGLPDNRLGQKLTLFLEGRGPDQGFLGGLKELVPKYHCPQGIVVITKFEETDSGKLNRRKTVSAYLNK